MKKIKQIFLVFTLILSFSQNVYSQKYPVSVSTNLLFPYPIFLNEYSETGSMDMQVTLILNDFNITSKAVKLRVTISNGDIELKTKDDYFQTNQIILTPGVPLILQGSDLYDALNTNNLIYSGITPAQITNNAGKLPEGQYSFCVEVLDVLTKVPLSLQSCKNVFLREIDPPIVMTPECGVRVLTSNPQNITINWQLNGGNIPSTDGFNTYKVFIYQITDKTTQDPQNAVMNSKAVKVFESEYSTQTTFNLDFSSVLLVPGERYVFRIKGIGPNDKQVFSHDGFSEWCWFSYGYPEDGVIVLSDPFEERQFSKSDQKVFSWGGSDKAVNGQPFDYRIKIVKLNDLDQDPIDAMANNSIYFESLLSTVTSSDGSNFVLDQQLDPDTKYAWKIITFSDVQQVAESEIRTFYSHSLIEEFYASNQVIKIINITNPTLTDLAGKARIQLSADEDDFQDVDFEHISIKEVAGQMIMETGSINIDFSEKEQMDLVMTLAENGTAKFEFLTGLISPTGLSVNGKIHWEISHAVTPGEATKVIGVESTFVMNGNGELTGESAIELFNTELIDPLGFKMKFFETSLLQLAVNKLNINVKGEVEFPESVKDFDGQNIFLKIDNYINSINYIEFNSLVGKFSEGISPIGNLNLEIIPESNGVLDLSESESPGKMSSLPEWKGFYIGEYVIRLNATQFDPTNQIDMPERIDINQTTNQTSNVFTITGTGLNLKCNFEIEDKEGLTFNSFQTKTFRCDFDIKNSEFENVTIEGSTLIPFLNDENNFDYKIPLTSEGLEQGYIDGLEDYNFTYNPYGGENKIDIVINTFSFIDNEYLALNIDANLEGIGVLIESLSGLRIYGDNFIGFGGKNKSMTLDNPLPGMFKQLPVTVIEIGGSLISGNYVLSYGMESVLSDGMTSQDGGAPKFSISSAVETSATFEGEAPAPDIEVPEEALTGSEEIVPMGFSISIETPILDADAILEFTENDPEWGTKFQASVAAEVKIPAKYTLGGNFVFGMVNNMDYWYLDAYFQDHDGTGIPVIEPLTQTKITNIVGVEGQMYRHMKSEAVADDPGKLELTLAPNVQFGAKMYLQMIDPYTNGFLYQAQVGLEAEMLGTGTNVDAFVVTISGEAAFLNASVRTGVSMDAVAGAVAEVVAESGITDAAFAAIFPIPIPMLDHEIIINSEGLTGKTKLSLGDFDAGSGLFFEGDLGSTLGGSVGVAYDGYSVSGGGTADGSGNLAFSMSDVSLSASLENKVKGNFEMEIGDMTTSFSGDYVKKEVSFNLDYDNLQLGLNLNQPDKKGDFDFSYDGLNISAYTSMSDKNGGFDFSYDSKEFEINFDGIDKKGDLSLIYDDYEFNAAFNATDKEGQLKLVAPTFEVELEGSETAAKFKAESGAYLFDLESDFVAETGKLQLKYPNHELSGEILEESANVFLKKNDFEIGLDGRFDGTAGQLHYKEGSFIFDVGANETEQTGFLDLTTSDIVFKSKYDLSDTTFVKYTNGTTDLHAAFNTNETYYKSYFKQDDSEFLLELNKSEVVGAAKFIIPNLSIEAEFDAPELTASTKISIDNVDFESQITSDSVMIKYGDENLDLFVSGNDQGSGVVSYVDQVNNFETGFSYDKETNAGAINFTKDDLTVKLEGDATNNSAYSFLKLGDSEFEGIIGDTLKVDVKLDSYTFSAKGKGSNISTAFGYLNNEVILSKSDNGEALQLNVLDKEFGIARENTDYIATYKAGGIEIESRLIDQNAVQINYSNGTTNINATLDNAKNFTSNLAKDGNSIAITGKVDDDEYQAVISNGDWYGTVNTDINTSSTDVELILERGTAETSIDFTTDNKTINYSIEDFTIKAGKKVGLSLFDVSFGESKLAIGELFGGTSDFTESTLATNDGSQPASNASSSSSNDTTSTNGTSTNGTSSTNSSSSNSTTSSNGSSSSVVSSNNTKQLNFQSNGVNIEFGEFNDLGDFNLAMNIEGVKFNILPDQSSTNTCGFTLRRNNTIIDFLGNTFEQTISGKTINLTLNTDGSSSIKYTHSDGLVLNVDVICNQIPAIYVEKDGKHYGFNINSTSANITFDDYVIDYNEAVFEVEVKATNDFGFKINENSVETHFNDYEFNLNNNEISVGSENETIVLSQTMVKVETEEQDIEINEDATFVLNIDTDKQIVASLGSVELIVDNKTLHIDASSITVVDTDFDYQAVATMDSLTISKADYKVVATLEEVKFSKGNDYVKVKNDRINSKYQDKELTVFADKKVKYKDATRELIASEQSLYLDYEGKILEVKDEFVRIKVDTDKEIIAKRTKLEATYGDYHVELENPLTNPAFSYTDTENELVLQEEHIKIQIGDDLLDVSPTNFEFKYDGDFLKFTENDMAFKYNKYEAEFNDFTDMFLTNGVQEFRVEENNIEARIDNDNYIKASNINNVPELVLVHNDDQLKVSTDGAEFDYKDMHYVMSKTEYLKVHEKGNPDNGFVFDEDGIEYEIDDTKVIKIAPVGDYISFTMDGNKKIAFTDELSLTASIDDYTATLYSDVTASFEKGDHIIELNKPDFMVGYKYIPSDIFVRFKKYEENQYGVVAGTEDYTGFVKVDNKNNITVGGNIKDLGEASVEISEDKDLKIDLKESDANYAFIKIKEASELESISIYADNAKVFAFGEEVDAFGEGPGGGLATTSADGPSHLTSITNTANGWAVGGVVMTATVSDNPSFIITGQVQTGLSVPILCGTVPFGAEITPGHIRLKIADASNWATLKLLCVGGLPSGIVTSGYADLDYSTSTGEINTAIGYQISSSINGSYSATVSGVTASLSIAASASFTLSGSTTIKIPTATDGLDFSIKANELSASVAAAGSITGSISYKVGEVTFTKSVSASASLSGTLKMSGSNASGIVNGNVTVAGKSISFDYNASVTI